jgi:glycosyltransferase involved in cell wall biosynthesis
LAFWEDAAIAGVHARDDFQDTGTNMRVVIVIPGSETGHSMIFARRQAEYLASNCGVDVCVFYLHDRQTLFGVFGELLRLRRCVKEFKPHCVHSQYGTVTSLLCRLCTSLPLIVTFRGSDLNGSSEISRLRSALGCLFSQLSALTATSIICVGANLRSRLWWKQKSAEVIPSGVNANYFHPIKKAEARQSLGWDQDEFVVLFNVGFTPKAKRLGMAEAAVAVAQSRVQRKIRLHVLRGDTLPSMMPQVVGASDCVLVTSDREGAPTIIQEALACTIPVVTVNVGDAASLIAGVNGCFMVEKDPQRIAEALLCVEAADSHCDSAERTRSLSLDSVCNRIVKCYEKAVNAKIDLKLPGATEVVFVTCNSPFGQGEEFLTEELMETLAQGLQSVIFPRSASAVLVNSDASALVGRSIRTPLINWRGVAALVRKSITRPLKMIEIVAAILRDSQNFSNIVKNLVVLPKAAELSVLIDGMPGIHLHAYWASTAATITFVAAELSGVSWSFSCHRGDIKLNNMLEVKVKRAAFVRTISEYGRQWILRSAHAEDSHKTHVIHLGVKSVVEYTPNAHRERNLIVFATPASFYPVKGHKYLIEACRILADERADFRVELIGRGPLKAEIDGLIGTLGLQKQVLANGSVDHAELLKKYAGGWVDAVILPSITTDQGEHEGIPVSLMEAMAHGLPVIATDSGSISELVNKENGILVAEKDSAALAKAMRQFLESEQLRQKLGEEGRRTIAREFSVTESSARFIHLIRNARRA